MCLIAFAINATSDYPLIILANRDEFHARPAAPLRQWNDEPDVLAGRDLRSGGTWLGVSKLGRFAAVTNVREQRAVPPHAPSRGKLVMDALRHEGDVSAFISIVDERGPHYAGFNLITGSPAEGVFYASNRFQAQHLGSGIHAVSNGVLNSPWPKVRELTAALERVLKEDPEPSDETLLSLLTDRSTPADERLPETGVGIEAERMLAPRFIVTPEYGTRVSTVVRYRGDGTVEMIEHTWNPDGTGASSVEANLQASQ